MRMLRAAIRMFRLAHESLLLVAVYTAGRGLLLLMPLRIRRSWRRVMYRAWARRMTSLFGVEAEIRGDVPHGAFLLVSNHLSYVDITVLAQCTDVAFIAKHDIRSWPLVGMLAVSVGTIFVKRESRRDALRVADEMARALEEERGVAVFPEGTATNGSLVLPFKPALLEVAARHAVPVYSAAIRYYTDDRRRPPETHVCWADDEPFVRHIWRLLQLPRVRARITFGPERRSGDRKELARQLWQDVRGALDEQQ